MPPYYHQPRRRNDPDRPPYLKTVAVSGLILLGLIIAWFAITAPDPAPRPSTPPQTTEQASVTEQRIALADGRILLCLSFPGQQVSCDWSRAYRSLAE